MRNNKTTKGNKRPIKKLIALWVVFAMLVVPFASHVGEKEGAKADDGAGTIPTEVSDYPQSVKKDISFTVTQNEDNTITNSSVPSVSFNLLNTAQKFSFKLGEITKNPNELSLIYRYVDVTSSEPEQELETGASGLTEFPTADGYVSVPDNKKYAIYAMIDGDSDGKPYKLQYVFEVKYVDSAFTSADTTLSESQYMSSLALSVGDGTAFDNTNGILYYIRKFDDTTIEADEIKKYSNYKSLNSYIFPDLYGKKVKVYAALVSNNNTEEISDDVVLEYKSLGEVNISNDSKSPTIAPAGDIKVWDSASSQYVNDSVSNYTVDNVYYGNSEKYRYVMNILDEGEDASDVDITGVDPSSITVTLVKLDGTGVLETLTNANTTLEAIPDGQFAYSTATGGLHMVLTDDQVTGGVMINVSAKDKKGNSKIFSSLSYTTPFAIKQVVPGTSVTSVAFSDGTSWEDVSQPITFGKLQTQKELVVTLKSTEVITKVTLKDGWEGVQVTPVENQAADRTYETKWTFKVPKGTDLTQSELLDGLQIKAYKSGNDTPLMIMGTTTLGTITYDAKAPVIDETKIKLQKRQSDSSGWIDVDTSTVPVVTEIDTETGVDYQYRYYIEVTDAGGSNIDKVYVGDAEATPYSGDIYTYTIPVSTWNAGYDYNNPTVYATDKAGNVSDTKQLPSLKKIDTNIKVDVSITNNEDGTPVANQDLSLNTNKKHNLSVTVSSAYPIKAIKLKGTEGYEQTKEYATRAESGSPNADNRYTVTYSFELPTGADNAKMNGMYLEITDYRPSAPSVPIRYPSDSTKFIGDILYDSTKPVFTKRSELDETKWYSEYTLGYTIASGNGTQTVESNLATATYTLGNCTGATGEAVSVLSATPVTQVSDTISIPQSTTPTGTTISFVVQDACENSLETPVNYTIKVDGKAPEITLFDVNEKTILSNALEGDVIIRANVSDNLTIASATIQVVGPDGINVTKSLCDAGERVGIGKDNSFTLDGLLGKKAPDGNYTVTVKVSDMAGNAATDRTISFTVDNTIPVVTAKIAGGTTAGKQPGTNFDGTVCDYFYRSNVPVVLTYEDDNLAASGVTVTDNGNKLKLNWERLGDSNKYQATYTATQEGPHTVKITAKDDAGNDAVAKQVVFIKDITAPTITAVLNGGIVYSEGMGEVDLTSAASLNLSVNDKNEDAQDFHYQLVKTAPDTLPVTADYINTNNRTFAFADEADYLVNAYAIDKAGNKGLIKSVLFRVDTTAPELKISGAASGSSLNAGTTLTFTMTEAFWKDASGTVTITRKAGDGVSESTYKTIDFKPTARTTNISESLTETGEYKVTFTAKDRAGHTSEAATYTVKIDKDKPVITLNGVANNDKTTGEVEFLAQIEDDFYLTKAISIKATRTYLDETTYQEKTEDIKFTGYNAAASDTIIRDTFKEDGFYKIQITCKDAAGNEDTQEVSFTIDKSKPVIDSKVLGAYEGTLTAFDWDYDISDLVYDLTVCDVHMYLNGSEYDGTSEIEDGAYEMKITAEDELGNYVEQIVNFTLDTKAPTFIVTGVEDGEVKNEQYTIEVSLQLDEDVLDSVSLNGSAVEVKDNKASLTVSDKGDYELTMKAHDAAGNEAEKTIHFTYGEKSTWWIYLIIGVAAVVGIGGVIFVVVRKKK